MYETHWGFERPPFQDGYDRRSHHEVETHEAALLKMQFVVDRGLGAGLFVGDGGMGKTYLVDAFEDRLSAGAGPVVRLIHPRMNGDDFLAYAAAELRDAAVAAGCANAEVTTDVPRPGEAVREIARALTAFADEGRQPVLVVDDLQYVEDPGCWRSLRLLLNHVDAGRGRAGFSLFLLGSPVVTARVASFAELDDRVGVKALLRPFDLADTIAYVQHRVTAAGGRDDVFEPAALHAVFALSRGVPRRVNRLCDMALLVGYAEQLDSISANVVEGVGEELSVVRSD